MASEYIITDRTTATNYSIQVDDGQLKWTSTASAASAEPIFEDKENSSDHWKLFIDDGEMAIESTVTVQDDTVSLDDVTTSQTWAIEVHDGQLLINDGAVTVAVGILPWIRRRRR